MKKRIIFAIDSFKGCLSSQQANQAAAAGIGAAMPDAEMIQIPVSDGGEGWLDAFQAAMGGERVTLTVSDPLRRPITAHYLVCNDTAVIEMAQASGLTLLTPDERNPLLVSSYGTGQLVADAVDKGCRNIIVGLGGSATCDAGVGMLRALIDRFAPNGTWDNIAALRNCRFTIATDVANPLCGPNGAAYVFGPQKFARPEDATSEALSMLESRLAHFAAASASHFGFDRQNLPGAGAAGGLGYAFLQYLNATSRPGICILLDAIHFDDLLRDAALVVTGEGSADRQTLMGKLPYGILQRAKAHRVPVALIAGRIADRQMLLDAGFSSVYSINPDHLPLSEALKPEVARKNIAQTLKRIPI